MPAVFPYMLRQHRPACRLSFEPRLTTAVWLAAARPGFVPTGHARRPLLPFLAFNLSVCGALSGHFEQVVMILTGKPAYGYSKTCQAIVDRYASRHSDRLF